MTLSNRLLRSRVSPHTIFGCCWFLEEIGRIDNSQSPSTFNREREHLIIQSKNSYPHNELRKSENHDLILKILNFSNCFQTKKLTTQIGDDNKKRVPAKQIVRHKQLKRQVRPHNNRKETVFFWTFHSKIIDIWRMPAQAACKVWKQ